MDVVSKMAGWTSSFLMVGCVTILFIMLHQGNSTVTAPFRWPFLTNIIHSAAEEQVIVYALPPHTTYPSQPLDRGCFAPRKVAQHDVCYLLSWISITSGNVCFKPSKWFAEVANKANTTLQAASAQTRFISRNSEHLAVSYSLLILLKAFAWNWHEC